MSDLPPVIKNIYVKQIVAYAFLWDRVRPLMITVVIDIVLIVIEHYNNNRTHS